MNQSNKALRDLVVKMVELLEDCHQELTKADESHWNGTSDSGGHNEAWEAKTKTAHAQIALLTNHIKELPSMQMETKEKLTPMNWKTDEGETIYYPSDNDGWEERNKVRHQLLTEINNMGDKE